MDNLERAVPTSGKKRQYRKRSKDKMIVMDRPMRYIQNLNEGKTKKESALLAGYSESTALQPSRIGTDRAMEKLQKLTSENKQTLGISLERIQNRINHIVFNQDKDLASATKLLIPLAKNHGVNLTTEETKVSVPILNIVVKETGKQSKESSIVEAQAANLIGEDMP